MAPPVPPEPTPPDPAPQADGLARLASEWLALRAAFAAAIGAVTAEGLGVGEADAGAVRGLMLARWGASEDELLRDLEDVDPGFAARFLTAIGCGLPGGG